MATKPHPEIPYRLRFEFDPVNKICSSELRVGSRMNRSQSVTGRFESIRLRPMPARVFGTCHPLPSLPYPPNFSVT